MIIQTVNFNFNFNYNVTDSEASKAYVEMPLNLQILRNKKT